MARRVFPRLCRLACETERKLDGPAKAGHHVHKDGPANPLRQGYGGREAGHYVLLLLVLLLAAPSWGLAQPEWLPAAETQATPERPAEGEAQAGA